MASKWTAVLVLCAKLAAAAAVASAPAGHEFEPPKPGQVRSPCPGLNSLANHGFLPRSGKGMTVPILIQGLQEGLNVGADFASSVGALGLMSAPHPSTSFNLNELDEHNYPIEHDGSLSREDYYEGNDYSFNQTIFNEVLAFYKGKTTATIPVAANARYNRIQRARAVNPDFIYGVRQVVLSYGETALYLSTMGNPVTGDAPLSYVKSLFEKQRLPYELGWTKPTVQTNLATLGLMVTQLQLAHPDSAAEGLDIGEGSLKDVYSLINPLTGKAENATCILNAFSPAADRT